jgi:phosphoglycolate phosphatase-like HAD superfamily hydrolase
MIDRRLYLFDIDGTLLNSGGAGSSAMKLAFQALWKRADGFDGIEFSGRTDRAILRDALDKARCSPNPFDHDVARFKRAYLRRLPRTLRDKPGTLLPGVVETLELLGRDAKATVAVATGNFRRGAALKLRHFGIDHHFVAGGYGDTVESREDMIDQALKACRPFGKHTTVFVIGDTIHDMACARAHSAIAVGVTTGPADRATLEAAGADIVLETMHDARKHILRRD